MMGYFAREALRSMLRSGPLALVALASLSLASLCGGAWGLLWANSLQWRLELGGRVQAVAYAHSGLSREACQQAFDKLQALPGVVSAEVVWPEAAAKELARDPALKAALETLGENPLPASLRVRLGDPSLEAVKAFAQAARGVSGVAEVDYGAEATEGLLKAIRVAERALLAAGALLALAALLVVALVIRLTAHQRRAEISIMRLVGADPWFIRAPFLLEGLFQGIVGGVLATLALTLALGALRSALSSELGLQLEAFLPLGLSLRYAALQVLATALLGLGGSALAFAPLKDKAEE